MFKHFHCEERGIFFQRIVGGIAWPGDRPGFVCVVGEETSYRLPHQLHLLAEAEKQDTSELIKRCRELQATWKVQEFYARLPEHILQYLGLSNEQARGRYQKSFQVLEAPFSSDPRIAYHLQLLRDTLKPAQKGLHLGTDSRLSSALLELPVDKAASAKDTDFPAVAALAYAVAALTVWEPLDDEDRPDTTDDQYEIFGY